MSSSSSSISAAAADDGGGGTPITVIHPDIIQSHILNKLDGPTLASTSCASTQFHSLCNDDYLWKDICSSNWPSTTDRRVSDAISAFSSGYRSFYSDAFPSIRRYQSKKSHVLEASELISAVDIYYDDKLIYSKVFVTETLSTWFLNTPFRFELLDTKETLKLESTWLSRATEDHVRVSWILIDPVKKRAVNFASKQAVESRRRWPSEDVQLRYATVLADDDGGELVQCGVVVTCGGEWGHVSVKEVSMMVEDIEGKILNGMESLRILEVAMEGQRCKSDSKTERDIYERFVMMKVRSRERKQRRESGFDMACTVIGICVFFTFFIIFLR